MIDNLERYIERLDVIREDLLPLLIVELEKAGLVLVITENAYLQGEEKEYNCVIQLNSVGGNTQ